VRGQDPDEAGAHRRATRPPPDQNPDREAGGLPPNVPTPDGHGRDRDTDGRPRNARPRDALGRPLAHGAAHAAPPLPERALPPADALLLTQRLLDTDRPFHAHEVLEAVWKAAPGPERELWRGLAQIAVGITHARRGNPRGAVALLTRGRERVGRYQPDPPHGLDIADITRQADALAAAMERRDPQPVTADSVRFSLTRAAGS
jgi:hypothetical protein